MIEVYEVDIHKSYFIDECLNIWQYIDDFYNYHFEEYEGIKDGYETWKENLLEEYKVTELMGDEVISKVVEELERDAEYYKSKYRELLEGKSEYNK